MSNSPPSPSPAAIIPGAPRKIPPTYQVFLDERAEPTEMDLGFQLGPSRIPSRLYPFLALCEEHGMIPYDEVLYEDDLQDFLNHQGVSEFLVMIYNFHRVAGKPSGGLDTEEAVLLNWADYVVIFVNQRGYLCEYQFDHGGNEFSSMKWEYTEECYKKAIRKMGFGIFHPCEWGFVTILFVRLLERLNLAMISVVLRIEVSDCSLNGSMTSQDSPQPYKATVPPSEAWQ
ncbi:hypothetical protein BJ508DRAFT_307631 [Ascobolus immersus RN42]|uniref:Uncharacterized protein n=1 Tax=Ascobolus immersus RN42 TaxID=1160509 RepID=A0A3N4I6D4_ASCIM|nr:hypothetical protein BJ508DRAFT_307631 [Ascobolus immersus RN42]